MAPKSGDTVPLRDYVDALRAADLRAVAIKEAADAKALDLARDAQTYRDEQANRLREQINSERGVYPTKTELQSIVAALELRIDANSQAVRDLARERQGVLALFSGARGLVLLVASLVIAAVAFLNFIHNYVP